MSATNTTETIKIKPRKIKVKQKGEYPKGKPFYANLKLLKDIDEANKDLSIVGVPIDPTTKKIAGAVKDENGRHIISGVLFKHTYSADKRHSWKKMDNWLKATASQPAPIEYKDFDLGCLISGNVGVLDFDCEADWNWFKGHFDIDLSKYLVSSNVSKHNCSCSNDEERTHHLYFKREGWFNGVKTAKPCITRIDEDGETTKRQIDYLRDSYEGGTPHTIKCPSGKDNDKRCWEHIPADKVILPLPHDIKFHFKDNWVKHDKTDKGSRAYKWLEIAKKLPASAIGSKDMENIARNLKSIHTPNSDIIEYMLLKKRENGGKRIGEQRSLQGRAEYTDEECISWIDGVLKSFNDYNNSKNPMCIRSLAKQHIEGSYLDICKKYLPTFGLHFDTRWLIEMTETISNPMERRDWVRKYYNHFFIQVSGEKRFKIYQQEYEENGKVCRIFEKQTKGDFTDGCGIDMVLTDDNKSQNTAKYWLNLKDPIYNRVKFNMFGITNERKPEYNTYNQFSGFSMAFVPNYAKREYDHLGDAINDHLKNILCSKDGQDNIDIDPYDYNRAWIYKLIVKGIRPCVALVYYSKEKGTGKSMWCGGFKKFVVGKNYSITQGNFSSMMKDQFTDYVEDKVLMLVEEMPDNSSNTKQGWDFLKTLTTEDDTTSRKFQTAPTMADIHISFMFLTNHFYSIDPEYADRRAFVNRVSAERKNDTEYFERLAKACDCYEGWENFIHRYIIDDYASFKDIDVLPVSNLIPSTTYRKQLLQRGADAILYFAKYLLEQMEYDEVAEGGDPFEHTYGKILRIEQLYDIYKDFVMTEGYTDYCKTQTNFVEKLENKLEIKVQSTHRVHKRSVKMDNKLSSAQSVSVKRTNAGLSIMINKDFIAKIQAVINSKTLTYNESIILPADKEDEMIFDLYKIVQFKYGDDPYGTPSALDDI